VSKVQNKKAHNTNAKTLKITLIKSGSGRLPVHRATLLGLGLRRQRQTVVLENTACTRGMINQVSYLVSVEPSE
jgi:large subunit ribosomal protein L30